MSCHFVIRCIVLCCLAMWVGCNSDSNRAEKGEDARASKKASGKKESKGRYSGKSLDGWKTQYDEMVSQLNLDDQESAKLKSAFESKLKPVKEWYAENGDRLAGLESKMKSALKEKSLSKMREFKSKATALRDEVLKLHEKYDQAIEDALSDEKRWKWFAHNNVQRIVKNGESLELSDSQIEKMYQIAYDAVVAAKSEHSPEQKGYGKLLDQFKSKVLNASQKKSFDALLKRKPLSFMY